MPAIRRIESQATAQKKVERKQAPLVGLELPTEMKPVDVEFSHYINLFYGREKIGKTTLAASFPDALFLATEPGTKGLSIYEFNHEHGGVTSWPVFQKAVDLLSKTDRFRTIVIDTVDRAYDMCLDWICQTRAIEYPGETSDGKEDYGKSWRAVRQEFIKQIHAITQGGRGVLFISHERHEVSKINSREITRVYPSMGNQARQVVEALVDYFFFADYINVSGKTERILICQGDESIFAGARKGLTKSFPRYLPLREEDGYEVLRQAFTGEYPGLDITTMTACKQSSPVTGRLIASERTKRATGQAGGGALPVRKIVRK